MKFWNICGSCAPKLYIWLSKSPNLFWFSTAPSTPKPFYLCHMRLNDHPQNLLYPILWTFSSALCSETWLPFKDIASHNVGPEPGDRPFPSFSLLLFLDHFPLLFPKHQFLWDACYQTVYSYPFLIQSSIHIWATPHPMHEQFKQLNSSLP